MNWATAVGIGTLAVWSSFALVSAFASAFPPLQMVAMCFSIAGFLGWAFYTLRGEYPRLRGIPAWGWVHGVGGLLVYHVLLLTAFSSAPRTHVNLINYTWPLFLVLASTVGRGRGGSALAIAGALIGFLGVAILIYSDGGREGFSVSSFIGYAAAFFAAVCWAAYSYFGGRFSDVKTSALPVFFLATAAISFALHILTEVTVLDAPTSAWAAVVFLALGPLGLSFLLWDIAIKRGDVRLLGVLAYLTPVASTVLLVAAGRANPSPSLVLAACLVFLGGLVGLRSSFNARETS